MSNYINIISKWEEEPQKIFSSTCKLQLQQMLTQVASLEDIYQTAQLPLELQ